MAAVTLGREELRRSEAPARALCTQRRPLRLGLVAASRLQPRWVARAFAGVAQCGFAEVAVIAHAGEPVSTLPWVWRAYGSVDRRLFAQGEDLLQPVDLVDGVAHGQLLSLRDAPWCKQLHGFDLDVVFLLDDVAQAGLEGVARYGAWRYGFGPGGATPAAAAGMRETADAACVTASALLARMPGERGERLLCQAWSRTFPLSLARTRRGLLPKTSEFVLRALRRLHDCGPEWIAACDRAPEAAPGARPAAGDCVRHVARIAPRVAARALRNALFMDHWFIAFHFGADEHWNGDLRAFRLLMPPKDRFWADPFPIERGGRYFVFFEELMYATGKAHISVIEVDRAGRCSRPVPVLERDYHLSYPFLVEHAGELYMVPETGQNGTVEVYRCVSFPDRWRLEKVLLEGAYTADATFHQEEGKWWMFVGIYSKGSESTEGADELHLYHSDDFFGPWKPHAANPVKSDVRSGRPAGGLYRTAGALYRPAQIGVPMYGAGVSVNKVLRLTPDEYLEKEVETIIPQHPSGILGLHTLNRAGPLTVIDGCTRVMRG
jgi:hypothetical protein